MARHRRLRNGYAMLAKLSGSCINPRDRRIYMIAKMVTIDVVSDVICPWCHLGKYRLDAALARVPEIAVSLRWRPYFLDPSIPAGGLDRREYLLAKFGEERMKTLHDPLIKVGKDEGVPYAFDKIMRTPNTMDAHRVIRWSLRSASQNHLVGAMFNAYWRDGLDIGNRDVLVKLAEGSGLNAKTVAADLASDKDKVEVLTEVRQAQVMGIQGVPTFVFGQKLGITGAQSVDVLLDGIRRASEGKA
jgi:predicted DsbA family dithiol-disulfide isomerase